MVARAREAGVQLSHSQALEEVARQHGFHDWNTCSARLPRSGEVPRSRYFEPIEDPLFVMPLTSDREALRVYRAVKDISAWAIRLDVMADNGTDDGFRALLGAVGMPRPYVFEKNRGRWPDGRLWLVDRSYDEFDGFAFSDQELAELGFESWMHSGYCAPGEVGALYPVLDDEFIMQPQYEGMKRLARLLLPLAVKVYQRLSTAPRGAGAAPAIAPTQPPRGPAIG